MYVFRFVWQVKRSLGGNVASQNSPNLQRIPCRSIESCSSSSSTDTASGSSNVETEIHELPRRQNFPEGKVKSETVCPSNGFSKSHVRLKQKLFSTEEDQPKCSSISDRESDDTCTKSMPLKRKFNKVSENSRIARNEATQYLERWQRKHIAEAVVDNAVNKTLSDLGLSPDSEFHQFSSESRNIELEGVSAVIQSRGLRQLSSEPHGTADMFKGLAAVDQFNDATERPSFSEMFHMVGCLESNPLSFPSDSTHSTSNVSKGWEKVSRKNSSNESENLNSKNQNSKDEPARIPYSGIKTEVICPTSIIDKALNAAIAEKGLVL